MARPRKPIEQRRRTGRAPGKDSAGRALPELAQIASLPMVDAGNLPEPPDDLGLAGRDLWRQIWLAGQRWISPGSDRPAVELACRLLDDLELTREVFAANRSPQHGRLCVAFSRELGSALGRLGFDPVARSQLGVAEVKGLSQLEQLIARRNDEANRKGS